MQLYDGSIAGKIIAAARWMQNSGLSPGRSGNISVRWQDGMLITASGIAASAMKPQTDIVYVDQKGVPATDQKAPSTEWPFHLAIYKSRLDCNAVVHCHSRYATALACVNKSIPAFHYMVAKAGGVEIPIAPYATFGSLELAAYAASTLKEHNACLLKNHGQIAIGDHLKIALELAEEVETLAAQYVTALTIGQPNILSFSEMEDVLLKFKTYGKP